MRTVIVVQARMGSTRLPGKTLAKIKGKPMLLHLMERLQKSKEADDVVIATSINPVDDAIESFAKEQGFNCFRGSEEDVLGRVIKTGLAFEADHVVRICADKIFVDAGELDELVRHHLSTGADYTTNKLAGGSGLPSWIEVVSMEALQKIDGELEKEKGVFEVNGLKEEECKAKCVRCRMPAVAELEEKSYCLDCWLLEANK